MLVPKVEHVHAILEPEGTGLCGFNDWGAGHAWVSGWDESSMGTDVTCPACIKKHFVYSNSTRIAGFELDELVRLAAAIRAASDTAPPFRSVEHGYRYYGAVLYHTVRRLRFVTRETIGSGIITRGVEAFRAVIR